MVNSNLPPYSNRGVENTERGPLNSCVDWFSCTFLVEQEPIEVIRILGLKPEQFKQMKSGGSGYRKGWFFNQIKVLYDGNENMGVHVDMSGEGCRTFEKYSNLTWLDLFIRFNVHYVAMVNVTRIDIAVDDFKGYFKIPNLIKYVKRGHVTSKFKMARGISNFVITTGEEIGYTLYFGRPSSDVQIRFYEKNIEQEMKGNVVPESAEVWNRTEIQARNDRADMIVRILSNDINKLGDVVTGILKNYINFRRAGYVSGKKTGDTNRSRWDSAKFWLDFLGDVDKLPLTLKPSEVTIEKKYDWFDYGVKKTWAMLCMAFPNDTNELINNFIATGMEKLEESDWDMIDDFRSKNISLEDYLEKIKNAHIPEGK